MLRKLISRLTPSAPRFGVRLFLGSFLVIVLHAGVVAHFLQRSEQATHESDYLEAGESLAASLAAAAAEPLLVRDYQAIDTLVERMTDSGGWIVRCTVLRPNGEILAECSGSQENTPLIVDRRVVVDGIVLGHVQVALSREHVLAGIAAKSASIWRSALLNASALVMLLALLMRRLAVRPVARLVEQVQSLGERDFGERIEFDGVREFRGFARALEGMRMEVLRARVDLVERNDELEEALAAAQHADQAKASFIATMSHEVRTPLMGVVGAASVLEDLGGLNPQQLDLLSTVTASSDCLLAQINDVLDYSKASSAMLELNEEEVEVGPWIEEAISVMCGRTRGDGLVLTAVVYSDAPQSVQGDRQRLRQVLLNILGNAAKFTTEGSIAVRVKSSLLGLRVEIEDTGPGLPKGRDPMELFEPFKQGQEHCPGGESGTGLGLSISRVFVEGMGGTIGACSTADGALFWFELPGVPDVAGSSVAALDLDLPDGVNVHGEPGVLLDAVRAQVAQWGFLDGGEQGTLLRLEELNQVASPARLLQLVQPELVEEKQPAVRVTMPELSVLVVDDNPVNRKVLESMLTRLGHRCCMAEDGKVAVEIFARQTFDLVLMDYHMPNMGGPEATRAMVAHSLRAAQVLPPVIAVSAAVSFTERQACADAGMDDILTKPFRIDELRHMLEERFGKPLQQARAA